MRPTTISTADIDAAVDIAASFAAACSAPCLHLLSSGVSETHRYVGL